MVKGANGRTDAGTPCTTILLSTYTRQTLIRDNTTGSDWHKHARVMTIDVTSNLLNYVNGADLFPG